MRVTFAGLLLLSAGCAEDVQPAAPQPRAQQARVAPGPVPADSRLRQPEGFVAMDDAGVSRLRSAALVDTARAAEVTAWVAPAGAGAGFVVATDVVHAGGPAVYGHTLQTWVRRGLRASESGVASLDEAARARSEPPHFTAEGKAARTSYVIGLPGGERLQSRAIHWLDAEGRLHDAMCQCAGLGCTTPPACTLPEIPDTARAADTVLGVATPPKTLRTANDHGTLDAPPHYTALPVATLESLSAAGAAAAPRRSGHRVQGLRGPDGGAVFLTEATWCAQGPACEAETLAERRRKAEVASLREDGRLRTVTSHSDRHAALPTFGYEIEQRDGFWAQTTLWNEGPVVHEVTCACAGLACALAQRSCSVTGPD